MLIFEVIAREQPVMSSWISDLALNQNGSVIMSLNNGRKYRVDNIGSSLYNDWIGAQSKGKFWHAAIRGKYLVTRVV